MQYTNTYESSLGNILIAADNLGLTGLWFENQKYFAQNLDPNHEMKDLPIFNETKQWLNIYFSGRNPKSIPQLHIMGSPFRMKVWRILLQIPYGEVMTYGEISKKIAAEMNLPRISAQAIGGAIGHNKISIIIPCHRVIGHNGNLTGYAAGINKKAKLLELERIDVSKFTCTKTT